MPAPDKSGEAPSTSSSDGLQEGIARLRDLAKYLIAAFAAVGGILVAGSQLASLGKLSLDDDRDRFLAAIGGLGLALVMVGIVLVLAVRVLRPVEVDVEKLLDARPGPKDDPLPAGASSLRALVEASRDEENDEADRQAYAALVQQAIDLKAYRVVQSRFTAALVGLLAAALLGAIGITVFAYAANPPDEKKAGAAEPPVPPRPTAVGVRLTSEGRTALGPKIGERCARGTISALAIGGTAAEPVVVVLPRRRCAALQITLSQNLGVATAP